MLVEKPATQANGTPASLQNPWHTLTREQAVETLGVNVDTGLTSDQAAQRLLQYGSNELEEKALTSPWAILWEQITNPLVLLLIFAAVISAFLGKVDSVIAIMAIVIINAVLGVVQEYRAEQAMAALKKMAAPLVRVRRDGRVLDIESRDLVPGDVILLEAGSIIPADSRLWENANLRVQEASLTGESQPVDKRINPIAEANVPLGDRSNMLYMGTSVTYGRGVAVVAQTGMKTELGRIAELIQTVDTEKTPLQRRMDELGSTLLKASLVVMILAFIVGILDGQPIIPDSTRPDQESVLLNAVAIAVAVVPEGLPAVVTIALALGAQRMLRRRALIRKLPAVETLGSVTTICSDKTGTLTENLMTVTVIDVAGRTSNMVEVASQGINRLIEQSEMEHGVLSHEQAILLAAGVLSNDAILQTQQDTPGQFSSIGDPTEGALVIAAANFGLLKPQVDRILPRVAEVPFDSERKRMTTIHRLDHTLQLEQVEKYLVELFELTKESYVAFTKGAVDSLLYVATHVRINDEILEFTPELRQRIVDSNNKLAEAGLRVLGLAYRSLDTLPEVVDEKEIERDLILVGMVGIIDPPRKEVRDAVAVCKTAGIRPVMITGDHPLTAYAIARELGIIDDDGRVLTGHDLSQMTEEQLLAQVEQVAVYARVSPENKLNIVAALQKRGHITAMTGDGVNDAPALRRSNIGVAMGITGTAVSKEASDMVILDDNFATIVHAVEEGRTIYENVRRFVKYLLASNTGELFVLLATQLIPGMHIPLTTLQILWMNLITDGVPALALGVEGSEKGGMNRPPVNPKESLFSRGLGRHIILVGLLLGLTGLGLAYWAYSNNVLAANGEPAWNTMVFMFLTIAQMGHAYGLRSHRETVFGMNPWSNKLLIIAIVVTLVTQMMAVYLPFFNNIFNTNPLTAGQLAICLILSTVVFWGVELEKYFIRRGVLNA